MPTPQDLEGNVIRYAVRVATSVDLARLKHGILEGQTTPTALPLHSVEGQAGGPQGRQIKNSGRIWSFDFLKYVGGHVTATPLTGAVLTGPMSGCYLFKYTRAGRQYISHVGTTDPVTDPSTGVNSPSEATKAVKKAWSAFAARPDVTGVMGGNPFHVHTLADLQAAVATPGEAPTVLGYFNASGNGFAMLFAKVKSAAGPMALPGVLQIQAIKPMTLQPWSTLKTLPVFKE